MSICSCVTIQVNKLRIHDIGHIQHSFILIQINIGYTTTSSLSSTNGKNHRKLCKSIWWRVLNILHLCIFHGVLAKDAPHKMWKMRNWALSSCNLTKIIWVITIQIAANSHKFRTRCAMAHVDSCFTPTMNAVSTQPGMKAFCLQHWALGELKCGGKVSCRQRRGNPVIHL